MEEIGIFIYFSLVCIGEILYGSLKGIFLIFVLSGHCTGRKSSKNKILMQHTHRSHAEPEERKQGPKTGTIVQENSV